MDSITHLPGTPSNGMPFSLCGKSKITFVPTEWIASEFQQAQGVSCAKCLRFQGKSNAKGGDKIMQITHAYAELDGHAMLPGKKAPIGGTFTVKSKGRYKHANGDEEYVIGNCFVQCHPGQLTIGHTYRIDATDDVSWTVTDLSAEQTGSVPVPAYGTPFTVYGTKDSRALHVGDSVYISDTKHRDCFEPEIRKNDDGCWIVHPGTIKDVTRPQVGAWYVVTGDDGVRTSLAQRPAPAPTAVAPATSRLTVRMEDDNAHRLYGCVGAYFRINSLGRVSAIEIEGPYTLVWMDSLPNEISKFEVGTTYIVVTSLADRYFEVEKVAGAAHTSVPAATVAPLPAQQEQDTTMNGTLYMGSVVRTKTVAAGEGVTTGVQISECVFTTKLPKVYPNAASASAAILVAAKLELKDALDLEDVRQPLEVKLSTPNAQ